MDKVFLFLFFIVCLIGCTSCVSGAIPSDLGKRTVETGDAIGGTGAAIDASIAAHGELEDTIADAGRTNSDALGRVDDIGKTVGAGEAAIGEIKDIVRRVRERGVIDYPKKE